MRHPKKPLSHPSLAAVTPKGPGGGQGVSGSQLAAPFNDAVVGAGNVCPPSGTLGCAGELILHLPSSHPSTQRLRNILPQGMKGPPSPKMPLGEGC